MKLTESQKFELRREAYRSFLTKPWDADQKKEEERFWNRLREIDKFETIPTIQCA